MDEKLSSSIVQISLFSFISHKMAVAAILG
jgi:hypothetical protein